MCAHKHTHMPRGKELLLILLLLPYADKQTEKMEDVKLQVGRRMQSWPGSVYFVHTMQHCSPHFCRPFGFALHSFDLRCFCFTTLSGVLFASVLCLLCPVVMLANQLAPFVCVLFCSLVFDSLSSSHVIIVISCCLSKHSLVYWSIGDIAPPGGVALFSRALRTLTYRHIYSISISLFIFVQLGS